MDIHTSAGPSQKAGLPIFILAVAAFVLLTTEFLILGLLPPLARDLGISISVAGQLVTVFAVVVVLVGPDRDAALATATLLGMLAFGMAGVSAAAGWLPGVVLAMMVWAMAYTALFPVCQVRVMQAGAQAKALAGTLNVSASNAGIGLGAAIGGMAIPLLGLDGIGYLSAAIAVAGVLVALMIRRGSRT